MEDKKVDRKLLSLGDFSATGNASIIQFREDMYMALVDKYPKIKSLDDIHFMFVSNVHKFVRIRVKPRETKINGIMAKVFAIIPAPGQWIELMKPRQNKTLIVTIFIEVKSNVSDENVYIPFAQVNYLF